MDIWFGGAALSRVAPDARVLTIDTNEIGVDLTTFSPAMARGARFVRAKLPPRTIMIDIVLGSFAPEDRRRELAQICAWAYSSDPAPLTASHMRGEYFIAVCSKFPKFTGNDPGAKISLEFTAIQPDYIDASARSAAYNEDLRVGGILPTWVDLTATLTTSALELTWTLDGKTILLSGSIPAGVIAIDSFHETIQHTDGSGNVTSLLGMLDYDSDFWLLVPGVYTPTATIGTFTWRERRL